MSQRVSEDIVIDGWRRSNVLQTGQNSEVWQVAEVGGTRRCVMKLLLPELIGKASHRKMLKHEDAVGRSLEHPFIIDFHGYHGNKGNPYLLMEYFPSANLKLRLLRQEHDEFIRPNFRKLMLRTAAALGHLHDKGWVHRDVKPDNLLTNKACEVRLIDFALAERIAGKWKKMFARSKTSAGTRSYMSPEQIRGLPLDQRADIYSLGVMAYEIAAGKLPYVATSANELLQKHVYAQVPELHPDTGVTDAFRGLVARMMSKKPEARPENTDEFIAELNRIRIYEDEDLTKSK